MNAGPSASQWNFPVELPSGNLGKGCQRGILSPSSHHAAPDHQHNAKENENRAPARLLTFRS